MKFSIIRTVGVLVLLFAAAAISQTNAQSVSGSIGNGTASRGKTTRATVILNIPAGLHVNSNRPGWENAIATSVTAKAKGVTIGRVIYPPGHNRKFDFSDTPINVYEGRVPMTFNITVPTGNRARTISVKVTVRYQACTTEVCYLPKNKQLTLTARVN